MRSIARLICSRVAPLVRNCSKSTESELVSPARSSRSAMWWRSSWELRVSRPCSTSRPRIRRCSIRFSLIWACRSSKPSSPSSIAYRKGLSPSKRTWGPSRTEVRRSPPLRSPRRAGGEYHPGAKGEGLAGCCFVLLNRGEETSIQCPPPNDVVRVVLRVLPRVGGPASCGMANGPDSPLGNRDRLQFRRANSTMGRRPSPRKRGRQHPHSDRLRSPGTDQPGVRRR